jgi:hypothetical protein
MNAISRVVVFNHVMQGGAIIVSCVVALTQECSVLCQRASLLKTPALPLKAANVLYPSFTLPYEGSVNLFFDRAVESRLQKTI